MKKSERRLREDVVEKNNRHQWLHVTSFLLCTWHTAEWIELTLQQRDMGTVYDWWKHPHDLPIKRLLLCYCNCTNILYRSHIYTHIHVCSRIGAIHKKTDRSSKTLAFHHGSCDVSWKSWQNALKSSIAAYFLSIYSQQSLAARSNCCSPTALALDLRLPPLASPSEAWHHGEMKVRLFFFTPEN